MTTTRRGRRSSRSRSRARLLLLTEDPTTTTVRILNDTGILEPSSTLHHPNNRKRYRADAYKIREIHIFTRPTGGATVSKAQFSLRRREGGGRCSWWNGRAFRRGGCNSQRWLGAKELEANFFFYRLDELEPTGHGIRSYTAFSRATDVTGNVERTLGVGRNANTFKVKPARR